MLSRLTNNSTKEKNTKAKATIVREKAGSAKSGKAA